MKTIKFLTAAFFATALFTACNEEAGTNEESDTVIIREDSNEEPVKGQEDRDNSINFEVGSDEEGNVSGGVEGDVDLDKDNK